MKDFMLGSSYYPEWWDESEWETDFAKMEELGLNCVRMGEFAWSWYEPCEGEYNFEPMKRAMDCAQRHGISVILGTTTAVCPAWLYKKHPTVKGGNVNGHYDFGGRKGQCLSDKHFLEYAKKITEAQAQALGNHPALIGWQLDNEPGYPFNDFDPTCSAEFRNYLCEKYGDIEKLNKAWFTMEWSNRYNSFDEIDLPVNSSEGGWTLQIQLDYRKFFSRNFNRLLSMEAEIVRRYSPNRFLYTNWPGANWVVNCFDGSEYLDYAAWDNYVGQPNGENYRVQLRAAMEHSFDRRLDKNHREFLVAEQKCFVDANTDPMVINAQTWLNVAYGAFGTIFFEWRSPTGGAEQGYGSLLSSSLSFRKETKPVFEQLSKDIKRIYPYINHAETKAEAAAVYSYENSWGTPNWTVDGAYDEEFFNLYGGFQNVLKSNIDIAGLQDDISKYKLVIMANNRIISQEQAKKLEKFVAEGGMLVINTSCGTRDEYNKELTLTLPGLLAEVAGAVADGEIFADDFKKQAQAPCTVAFPDANREVHSFVHTLETSTAKAVATYVGGRLEGKPAVTVNKFGKGFCVLFASNASYKQDTNDVLFYESLAKLVKEYTDITPLMPQSDDGILFASRIQGENEYTFAINMKDRPLSLTLPKKARELLSEKELDGQVSLNAYEAMIFENL